MAFAIMLITYWLIWGALGRRRSSVPADFYWPKAQPLTARRRAALQAFREAQQLQKPRYAPLSAWIGKP